MYLINSIPISRWGMRAGVIGSRSDGYALSGVWSLPKRLGDTHYDWQDEVEPYVAAEDINLDGRDLSLSLACTASSAESRHTRIDKFCAELPDSFTLKHPTLGSFVVGVQKVDVKHHLKQWGTLTLNLREPRPVIGGVLPMKDNGDFGIDGYSWKQLGLVVESMDGYHGRSDWQPLPVTTDPRSDHWVAGYRSPATVTLQGTIVGATYVDFMAKVRALQSLLSAPGTRTIRCFDGATIIAFCVDGFDVSQVMNFKPVHWGQFTCKMIKL